MNEKELDKLLEDVTSFLDSIIEKEIEFEYEGSFEEDMKKDEANYIIITKNTPSGLLRIVKLRNRIMNSNRFSVYEFIEEQVADQMADGDDNLVVDFYISYKTV